MQKQYQLLSLSYSSVCVLSKCYNHSIDYEKEPACYVFFIHSFIHTCISLSSQQIFKCLLVLYVSEVIPVSLWN